MIYTYMFHDCTTIIHTFAIRQTIKVENTERFWTNESNFEIPVQKIDQLVYESHYD